IRLVSSPGKGSTFTLYMPQAYVPPKPIRRPSPAGSENGSARISLDGDSTVTAPAAIPAPYALDGATMIIEAPRLINEAGDDRDTVQPGDRVLLIVENDLSF